MRHKMTLGIDFGGSSSNDQISLKEFTDPFTGEPVKQGK